MTNRGTEEAPSPHRFTTTRWSVILASGETAGDEEKIRAALAQLCQIYWRPIFAFILRNGCSIDDAQDLTQDFFCTILEGDFLQRANPERGRFRSLLLTSLKNFLIDAHNRRRAKKRGGDVNFVSWDDWMAEAPSHLSLPERAIESWPAEKLFDVRWAATIVERALRRLREECEARGRRRVYDAVSGLLAAERADIRYDKLSQELGVPQAVVKRLLHQMRRRYRDLLREEVADTVVRAEEVDDELRYLCSVLALKES